MNYSFARIGAVVAMKVDDYYPGNKRWWVRLHEKGGKRHEMPAHHKLEAFIDEYLAAAGIREDGKSLLFRSAIGKTDVLTEKPMNRVDAYRMVRRRTADVGFKIKLGCPRVPRDGHHRISRSRRLARKRAGHGGA